MSLEDAKPARAGGGEDRRYADRKWRVVGPKRSMDAAQRVFEELCDDILAFDERKPADQQMEQSAFDTLVERMRSFLRDLYRAGMTDAAELKREGREMAGLPKRLKKIG